MKRLLAVLLVAALAVAAGCSSGSSGPEPVRGAQLGGLYVYFETVTAQVCRWKSFGGQMAVEVEGENVFLTWTGTRRIGPVSLSADGNGFSGAWQNGAGGSTSISGSVVTSQQITGDLYATSSSGCWIRSTWKADRI
jgi:hypothetical protein